ncbi:MAG: tRNA pseudouridine(55) synthase TruB [Clostridia bacterium]
MQEVESGIILLNKPTGMSSNFAVNKVKWLVGAKKAGHLGTLDPLGSGILPITINKGTRLFDFFLKKKKVYRAVFKFGVQTDTLDSEGVVTKTCNINICENEILKVIGMLLGKQNQLPPQFSAKKINGKKAYELARENIFVELKTKEVMIYRFDLIKQICTNTFLFEIECSEGTYIRSLCRDLAALLSTCGIMCAICRTICGAMQIEDAYTLDQIKNHQHQLIKCENAIPLLKYFLKDEFYDDLICGRSVLVDDIFNEKFLLYCKNEFFGIARIEDKKVKIISYLKD